MVTFTVSEKENGRRLDRVIRERYPEVGRDLLFKLLRKKDIRVNGNRTGENILLFCNDRVSVYVKLARHYRVIYENSDLLVVSKEQGIPVQSDGNLECSLLEEIRADFGENCKLCHRIDRNTGGIVVFAKNSETEAQWLRRFREGQVQKYYSCIVQGKMPEQEAIEAAWLFKDNKKSRVYIYGEKRTGARPIRTGYRVERYDSENNVSYLRVRLYTGRTHQIRAHLAYLGHPIVGDGKYGVLDTKRGLGLRFQALWASEIETELFFLKDPPRFR